LYHEWQVFWLTPFLRPSHLPFIRETVARSAKIIQSLQLRVQLRNLTGFPLDTRTSITNSSANIRQNQFQDQEGKEKIQQNYQHEENSVDNFKMQ
jgi:hypothetical protein